MTAPILIQVTRYRCPHCRRTHSSKSRAVTHMSRCWSNPDAHGCKTCAHFVPYDPADCEGGVIYASDVPEYCEQGVDLRGTEVIEAEVGRDPLRVGVWVKPGPIIGCEKWEATA